MDSLYDLYGRGEPSSLPPLPLQYPDFACWQRDWLQGNTLEPQLSYWRQNLKDPDAVVDLPGDRPRPSVLTRKGERISVDLSIEATRRLKSACTTQGVTLFMMLMGALKVLLHRYTAQTDIVVGSPIACRNRLEIEDLIGFFVNTLAMRSFVTGDLTFAEVLRREKETALGAYAHQDVPFEKLVEELDPERDLARNPIFQVMFVLQSGPEVILRLSGMDVAPVTVYSQTAKFDLSLAVGEIADGLRIGFEYASDLFDYTTIQRLADHYTNLMSRAAFNSGLTVSGVSLLTASEEHQLAVEWNDTQCSHDSEGSIDRVFAEQVSMTPDSIAAVCAEAQLTYRALDRSSNRLANRLVALEPGQEFVAGLCFERSIDMVVTIIAVLKAGGAYLPLDPSYPPERLESIISDVSPSVLLVQDQFKDAFSFARAHLICPDSASETPSAISDAAPPQLSNAETLAYVMYTSGSTGGPKGVTVRHKSVLRLVKEAGYVNLSSEDRILQLASISFDASTFEIWGALLNGGHMVLFPGQRASLDEIGEVLQQEQITTLWLTAGLFHQMVDSAIEGVRGVRQLLAGGDILSVSHAHKVLERFPGRVTVINGYGPTENTTFTCCNPVHSSQDLTEDAFPIGRPIADTQVHVLDPLLGRSPIGVMGELLIGGEGLARGYARRPLLTAEKFVPNPFGAEPGGRLYRTGDLVRCRPNSAIQFLGRFDHQVKVRGYRIELGEIESVLSEYPGLLESVVVAYTDGDGDKRLIAYVVMDKTSTTNASELRTYLKTRLPEYMAPSSYIVLDEFPLTGNGKVNRRALPMPDRIRSDGESARARTPVEEVIRDIWADVLKVDELGIH
ncbi:MAG TPA: amino acid adenylation domain-containing protein, partial [Blastocatellia bacterium]